MSLRTQNYSRSHSFSITSDRTNATTLFPPIRRNAFGATALFARINGLTQRSFPAFAQIAHLQAVIDARLLDLGKRAEGDDPQPTARFATRTLEQRACREAFGMPIAAG